VSFIFADECAKIPTVYIFCYVNGRSSVFGVFGMAYQVLDYAMKQCARNSRSISFPAADSDMMWKMLYCRV
jgi:hypothetical protein